MSMYLKGLGIHVYFVTTRDSYCLNGKNIEANVKAIHVLKSTLNDDYLCRVANLDSAFVVWNIILSLGEKNNRATRILEVTLPMYATWSKGITPIR